MAERAETDAAVSSGSGILTVDGLSYPFTPTTCFISEEDFVAAGPGFVDTDQFWVSASSVSLDLAVGTEGELDQPTDDQVWLISNANVDWHATGRTVVAEAPMSDRRSPDSPTVVGTLELRCDADS